MVTVASDGIGSIEAQFFFQVVVGGRLPVRHLVRVCYPITLRVWRANEMNRSFADLPRECKVLRRTIRLAGHASDGPTASVACEFG